MELQCSGQLVNWSYGQYPFKPGNPISIHKNVICDQKFDQILSPSLMDLFQSFQIFQRQLETSLLCSFSIVRGHIYGSYGQIFGTA